MSKPYSEKPKAIMLPMEPAPVMLMPWNGMMGKGGMW
jgi:hypothetical protein